MSQEALPNALAEVADVTISPHAAASVFTAAEQICLILDQSGGPNVSDEAHGLVVDIAGGTFDDPAIPVDRTRTSWCYAKIAADGTGCILASQGSLLYSFVHHIIEGLPVDTEAALREGITVYPTFEMLRPLFDSVLTQVGRTHYGFDEEAHIERIARSGFTHVEINGMASAHPQEPGVRSEFYRQFYTYCAGFNHFVDSSLTRGIYDYSYLEANLNRAKRLARIGLDYGLKPGMLMFEPRAMPEEFFQRYPTLRGARVDHPFRSHLPRYTLAQDHPASRQHYREVVMRLMDAIPELSYFSFWTNDSGAGFEHTASLYVGRNGGPYLIREWRSHEKIAVTAGKSAVRWLRLIRDTAAEVNPDFEVNLRIEPFKVEHDTIIEGMGDGVTVEAPSLMVRGYDLPYHHPKYPEFTSIAGTVFHDYMDDKEKEVLDRWRGMGFEPKLNFSTSSSFNFEPLIGTPFPGLLYRKLKAFENLTVKHASAFGGLLDTESAPYCPNPDLLRAIQYNPSASLETMLTRIATEMVGSKDAAALVEGWNLVEDGLSWFPVVPLYMNFGFVWYRLWTRPFIPNLEAPSFDERHYYERFMVTLHNNPNNVDLGKDVLFELITQEAAIMMTKAFDENALPRLETAIAAIEAMGNTCEGENFDAFDDLLDRARVLQCWARTLRSVVAWVAAMYQHQAATTDAERAKHYAFLQDAIDKDLDNTRNLIDLLETTQHDLIVVSGDTETPFVYGENLIEQLHNKIALTEKYRSVDPYIDPDIMWRI